MAGTAHGRFCGSVGELEEPRRQDSSVQSQFSPSATVSGDQQEQNRHYSISKHLHPVLAGNLPGRHAGHVWYTIMRDMENVQLQGSNLSGGVIDLIKAFNLIPRVLVFHFMTVLQVPSQILRAWSQAAVNMTRRFVTQNCVGPPLRSVTSFPEGDAVMPSAFVPCLHATCSASVYETVFPIRCTLDVRI